MLSVSKNNYQIHKIIQIGPYPESSSIIKGGVEASVYGLAQVQSFNAEIHVFDLPRIGYAPKVEEDGNVIVHRYLNEGKHHVASVRMVNRIVEDIVKLSPDVCHIHGTSLFSLLIYSNLTKNGCPTILTVHGLTHIEKKKKYKSKPSLKSLIQYLYQGLAEKCLLSTIPMAIVDTEYVKLEIQKYTKRRNLPVHVIPQGINDDFFSIQCSPDSNILLSVGAFVERKGHLFTIHAFENLRQQGIMARLYIVGSLSNKEYYEEVQNCVLMSLYKKDIVLITDTPVQDLKKLYGSARLFVLHSQEESQGIVFAEAMAVGLPVVATKVGGIPYIVQDEHSGLLSNYGDVDGFTHNIKTLLLDSCLWKSMSINARKNAQHYRWTDISKRISDCYITASQTDSYF